MTHRTLSLVAHPDDDLLFLNPDIASDIQAGQATWVVYLTAGNTTAGPAGMPYADARINGVRAAYARAAKVPNSWEFQLLTLPGGRRLATNYLAAAPHVRLVFTFVNAANGPDNGDLCRMWADPTFVSNPIDGRPGYTREQFVGMLRELIAHVDPTFLRTLDPFGAPLDDHIDHTHAARSVMAANLDPAGRVLRRTDVYFAYAISRWPAQYDGYWQVEKRAIWAAYKPHDPAVAGTSTWNELDCRQVRRHVWMTGDTYTQL